MRRLLSEPHQRRGTPTFALINDGVEPVGKLSAKVVNVAELAAIEERTEARLLARPLSSLGSEPAGIIRHALQELLPVLCALSDIVIHAVKPEVQTVQREAGT